MMDIFDNVFLEEHANRTFQYIYVAERYLHFQNAPEAPINCIENSPTVRALSKCNIAMQVVAVDMEEMRKAVLVDARDSGIGVDISFMDFGSFENLLNSLRNIGPNYTAMSLPPLTEYIHGILTRNADRYLVVGKSMPEKGPVKCLTEIFRPYGVTTTNSDILSYMPNMNRLKTAVLTHGTNLDCQAFPLNLPLDKVMGINKIDSPNNYGEPARLFLVVGPSDELLCGELGETFVERSEASEAMHVTRNVQGGEVVDQAYTAGFFFAEAGTTALGILEDTVTRCRLYTKVRRDASVYRELAVIQLGLVPYVGPATLVKKRDELRRVTSVRIHNFQVQLGPEWTYTTFQYSAREGFATNTTQFSHKRKETAGPDKDIVEPDTLKKPKYSVILPIPAPASEPVKDNSHRRGEIARPDKESAGLNIPKYSVIPPIPAPAQEPVKDKASKNQKKDISGSSPKPPTNRQRSSKLSTDVRFS